MALGTAERRQGLRLALIDAAERAVARGGLQALKARELAEAVGCALGAIYTVFPNLDALIFEVNARTLRDFEAFAGRSAAASAEPGDSPAVAELVRLALLYLDYAAANRPRWSALFEHRMAAAESAVPEWYATEQARLFALVEAPLGTLCPGIGREQAMVYARTLFSGVHGIVSLGLDEKLVGLPLAALKAQVGWFVRVFGRGLAGQG